MSTSKNALIVGASYGIGRAVAIGLAREGFNIAIVARGREGLEETKQEIEKTGNMCLVVETDISKRDQIDQSFELVSSNFNSIDLLWNGASPFAEEGLAEVDEQVIRDLADITYYGTLMFTKKFIPLLKAGEGGYIVNVATDWALPGSDGPAPFSAAKFALVGLTQGLNNELKEARVFATTLYLGEVGSMHSIDDPLEKVQNESGQVIILEDVVKTVSLLASLRTAFFPSITLLGKE